MLLEYNPHLHICQLAFRTQHLLLWRERMSMPSWSAGGWGGWDGIYTAWGLESVSHVCALLTTTTTTTPPHALIMSPMPLYPSSRSLLSSLPL